jgi:prepilin-type N-terminal cleavage/methylation domain-containing protein
MKLQKQNSGFSIIEVMIAIFIFAMAMASIFMVINSTLSTNNLNKNQIIASNLAREQIEIIRNLRDNNYATYHKWNYIPNSSNDYSLTINT